MSVSVYVHLGRDWELLYVGSSADVEARSGQHARNSHWWSDVVRVEIDSTHATRAEAVTREMGLIAARQPRWNYVGVAPETRVARRIVEHRDELPQTRLVTLKAAGKYLGLPPDSLSARARVGNFPARKFGGRWKVTPTDLERWADDFVAQHVTPTRGNGVRQ